MGCFHATTSKAKAHKRANFNRDYCYNLILFLGIAAPFCPPKTVLSWSSIQKPFYDAIREKKTTASNQNIRHATSTTNWLHSSFILSFHQTRWCVRSSAPAVWCLCLHVIHYYQGTHINNPGIFSLCPWLFFCLISCDNVMVWQGIEALSQKTFQ